MRRPWFDNPFLRAAALVLLFTTAGWYESVRQMSLTSITDGDFWWHLRTGLGILESRAWPHTGLYSQSAALPWMASSWLYDVLVATGYRALDLSFVVVLPVLCKLALAVLTFILAGGLRGRFWPAFVLSAVAQYVLGSLPPLPVYCSVLAFTVELLLLMECRRTGSARPLYWLPLLFLFWANLHVQFVYGILALLLFALACLIEQHGSRAGVARMESPSTPPLKIVGAVTAASFLATVITPYGWKLYGLFFAQETSAANRYFPDFLALRFRTPQDYVLLLLTMTAFLALGMRRSRDPFQIALLVLCTAAAFHSQRDAWLVALTALAVVGNALPHEAAVREQQSGTISSRQLLMSAGLVLALLTFSVAVRLPRGRKATLATLGNTFPVNAADYIREHQLPQPLFNSFPWGGFLTWYLPEYPVAIDGRTDLYGPDFNIQYAKVMNAEAHYSTFAPLRQAGTILLEKKSLMGAALASVPGFKTVYSDDVAVVLVRETPTQ